MKVFRAFVGKEFHHIFRDRRTLIILFGMPLAQLLLFGYAITTEVSSARIAVHNQSPGPLTDRLVTRLVASDFFRLEARVHSRQEVREVFARNRAKLVVVIPPDFERRCRRGDATIQLLADGSDPNLASTLTAAAEGVIRSWAVQEFAAGPPPRPVISTDVRWHYNPDLESAVMFVPGVMTIILMLVSAMLTSISITREKELGTIEILFVSPLRPAVIIVGKVVPFMLLSLVNAGTILVVARLVFGVPINGSLPLLVAESLLFTLTALSLGVLISTVTSTQQTALMLSLFALMLPTILISGFIFPIASMPLPLRLLSLFIPARWFLIIVRGVMLQGVGLADLWHETLILAVMTAFYIGMSVKKFKTRLS